MPEIRIPAVFPSPGDVAGRRVVVTGASKGLGRLIATAFWQNGAHVTLVARDPDALEQVRAQLEERVLAVSADVTDPDANQEVVDRTIAHFGGLDVWIANAGGSPVVADTTKMTTDDWLHIVDVNLNGAFYGVRAAGAAMQEDGRIIITGSVVGERPRRGLGPYAAAKAGVVALAKTMALELGPKGITVNVVAPGWFDSPLASGWVGNPRLEPEILGHTALNRWGESEDLAGAYLYLSSDAGRFVTGAVIAVDGGYLCV